MVWVIAAIVCQAFRVVITLARSTSNSMFWHSAPRLVVDWDTLQNHDTRPVPSLVSVGLIAAIIRMG
ncbi:hypothetical protein SCLCIDRAFT_590810 [Scleroderma citrinum Foug A]|uniref:Uncharacterized protein n=1 Tax=Scleroderma citrinum Foug A TaxID=1036808 RepID=A0A0C3DVZ5_9AGAM|nr:hypothetical protein SCLCIDRAFT_590810 [Scleroderma citrinum Foug A]